MSKNTQHIQYVSEEIVDEFAVSEEEFPLHYAAKHENIDEINSIINNKLIDINGLDRSNFTPLHHAAWGGCTDAAKILIEKGASIHSKEGMEELDALFLAVLGGHDEIIKELLKAGANINTTDVDGYTPLHLSSLKGFASTTELLLASGARTDIMPRNLRNPLHCAAYQQNTEIVRMLLDAQISINAVDHAGNTPIHFAVNSNNQSMIKILIEHGANLSIKNAGYQNPLSVSLLNKNNEVAKILIDSGASVNEPSGVSDWMPIHYAAVSCDSEILNLLIEKQADVNALDLEGRSPIFYAALRANISKNDKYTFENPHEEIINMLIEQGANMNFNREDLGVAKQVILKNKMTIYKNIYHLK